MEIYLDNAATTKPCKSAVDACVHTMEVEYGNPSSLHRRGFNAQNIVDNTRELVAHAIGVTCKEIIFTSGATESNNLAIIGTAMALKRRGNKIVSTTIEHKSVLTTLDYLETIGFEVVKVPPNANGEYTAADIIPFVDEKTILVSTMMVNNETGLLLPVVEIAEAVKAKNPAVIMHVDGVQGFIKLPLNLKKSCIDLFSFSGHKAYAPKGVGGLFVRQGVRLIPHSYGGSQQDGIRAGTEAVPLIAALGGAVKETACHSAINFAHYKTLNAHLINRLTDIGGITLNSTQNCVPYIINFSVKGVRSEIMLHFLEEHEIYISSGSACTKGQKSYVLEALGLCRELCDTAMRVSFCAQTTTAMLDCLVDQIKLATVTLTKSS